MKMLSMAQKFPINGEIFAIALSVWFLFDGLPFRVRTRFGNAFWTKKNFTPNIVISDYYDDEIVCRSRRARGYGYDIIDLESQ